MDAGLDSLSGVELKQQMESEFAVELPETVVFDYPTPASLASFVAERRGLRAAATTKTPIRMCVRRLRTRRRCIARGHAAADDDRDDARPRVVWRVRRRARRPFRPAWWRSSATYSVATSRPTSRSWTPVSTLSPASSSNNSWSLSSRWSFPETVVFDYPTATALSTFILERGEGDGDETETIASSDSYSDASFSSRASDAVLYATTTRPGVGRLAPRRGRLRRLLRSPHRSRRRSRLLRVRRR